MSFPAVEEQMAVIGRGVEKIVPEEELAAKLEKSRKTNTPLRIKYGIDPTGIDVHLGHTVPLRKMRQFQELGHQAVIIIGNYTALVGDPSGRDETRARLTQDQVEANAKDYLEQVGKVVDLSQAEVVRNGDWFAKMNFSDVLDLCGKVTIAQLLTRDDFSKRYKSEQPIFLHECLYPVMQAWDSVEIRADIELGGTEQLYSFMLARDLQKDANLAPQVSVMSPILVGTDGVRRMGKSLGNYIGISEPAYEMMKKFMQLPDTCMQMFYELLTEIPLDEINTLLAGHPKEAKLTLGKTVIAQYHGAAAGDEAAERWEREISQGALNEDIPTAPIAATDLQEGQLPAARLLVTAGLCKSTSDARRSIQQGGAYVGEEKQRLDDPNALITVADGMLLRVGKKRICRVKIDG
ncbi:Tyrosine--tRNA ligase [Symmachiella macrocystis]|uniref:Tyrosine--tRNA ligase n=1 Tax=Symmachiella macrocystis TaxID=2527985 RepID=A0A5C6BI76_9PLAN|nr:tyrosine--tRNA ligase [Symmachiella macrocystis]TWU11690.1 Tyrosine--tRNA ligase [Symmachiella macrocystis]